MTLEVVHAASGSRARRGAGGSWALVAWGFLFSFELEFFRLERAATYLLVMVGVAVLLDRLSRRLGLARGRFPE